LPILLVLAAGDVPDGGLPDPAELREQLLVTAMREEPCSALSALLGQADTLLDVKADSDGFELLGEILRVWGQACAGTPPSRHAQDADAAFAAATRLKPDAGVEAPAVEWHGLILRRTGEERLARARAALAKGDLFVARRELRLLHYESVDAAMALAEPDAEQALWAELKRREPSPHAGRKASSPEEAIHTLERAAVDDDAVAFTALLSRRSSQRAVLEGHGGEENACSEYRDERSLLLVCLLGELLPEAPERVACESVPDGHTSSCIVTGRSDQRTVYFEREGSVWHFSALSSGPP
jgi:hypothetical protein